MIKLRLVFLFICISLSSAAQLALPVDANMQRAYQKGTRQVSGKPGPAYWQNTADYHLLVNFHPESRLLKGTVTIDYVNHSPDTLHHLWFKLYPNLYKKGVMRKAKINDRDLGDGLAISAMHINGHPVPAADLIATGTNLQIPLAALLPKQRIKVHLTYSYQLNKGSHVRTGQVDEGSYFVAYFFPRIAVYDDVDGWNKYPYTGEEEFYNDFCNFKAEITLPGNYQVWATGDLQNTDEVYQAPIAARIRQAEAGDEVVAVITPADLSARTITKGISSNTWKFEASGVTDFVFATSNHYIWKSSSLVVDSATLRRTRVDAVYNPAHRDYDEVIDFARKTVSAMSFAFPKWPFPYSHETIFDGLDQMEYPMMVNDNPVAKREDAITLTVHEIFHTLFPFYMGTNETKHAWMDEGWATLGEWLLSPMIDSSIVDTYGVEQTAATSGSKNDSPVVTPTMALKGAGVFTNSYPKAGMGYLFVKDYLGDALFLKALHHYIREWNGKHPTPADFFNSMNEGAGENLNWFWKRWFFEEGVTDLALSSVTRNAGGYAITILNKSNKPLPVQLTLFYTDGSKGELKKTIGVWKSGENTATIQLATGLTLKKVVMGGPHIPDRDKRDNSLLIK